MLVTKAHGLPNFQLAQATALFFRFLCVAAPIAASVMAVRACSALSADEGKLGSVNALANAFFEAVRCLPTRMGFGSTNAARHCEFF